MPVFTFTPVIAVVCAIGAFTVNDAMLNIWTILTFGATGYTFITSQSRDES